MRERKRYPRSIRDVSPGPGYRRVERARPDGLPDGVHTGGCWIDEDETYVWKPLDGGNAHDGDHWETWELDCLQEMRGAFGFPGNWRVEEARGRRWLVRRKCLVAGQDFPMGELPAETGEQVELMLRELNGAGWELGDAVSLAYDRVLARTSNEHPWFILDLSCAAPTYKANANWDDEGRLERFWEENGWGGLLKLRRDARHVVTSLETLGRHEIPRGWRHVYASRHRPLSLTWARKLRDRAVLVPADYAATRVHTWAVCPGPLEKEICHDYELAVGWWPWKTPARERKDL